MTKLLVKTKRGVHIREKSGESLETVDSVHKNKVKTWLALSEASTGARGGTMEDVIAEVRKLQGTVFRENIKPKQQVTEAEYQSLIIQAQKKGITKTELDRLVVIVAEKEKSVKEMVEEFVKTRT